MEDRQLLSEPIPGNPRFLEEAGKGVPCKRNKPEFQEIGQAGYCQRQQGDLGDITIWTETHISSHGDPADLYSGNQLSQPARRAGYYPHGTTAALENVVQAIARDLLVRVILECEKAGIPIVLHIHDEVIACVPEDQAGQAMEKMIQIWRTVPQWAEGLVLDAEGVIGTNLAELK